MKTPTYIYIFLVLAALLMAVGNAFTGNTGNHTGYERYQVGRVSDRDIIAPFSFTVYKSDTQYRREREAVATKVPLIQTISDEAGFNLVARVRMFFDTLDAFGKGGNTVSGKGFPGKPGQADPVHLLSDSLASLGFTADAALISHLLTGNSAGRIRDAILDNLNGYLRSGIIADTHAGKSIHLWGENGISDIQIPSSAFPGSGTPLTAVSVAQIVTSTLQIPASLRPSMISLLGGILGSGNVVPDLGIMEREKTRLMESVSRTQGQVLKDELIVGRNQRIMAEDIVKLHSLSRALQEKNRFRFDTLMVNLAGVFIYCGMLLWILVRFTRRFHGKRIEHPGVLVTIFLMILFMTLLLLMVREWDMFDQRMLPVSFPILVVATIFTIGYSQAFSLLYLFILLPFIPWNGHFPVVHILSMAVALIFCPRFKDGRSLNFFLILLGAHLLLASLFAMINNDSWNIWLGNITFGAISETLAVLIALIFGPWLEKQLHLSTRKVLLDLLDFNAPLLKRMSELVPGTYSHSLIVGNLAESAADAIGANSLLARVGSYYHDLGKVEAPEYFIENNPGATRLHEKLEPRVSAQKLKEHVSLGVDLARRHHLPQAVLDIIRQHHGTSLVKYFYDKARRSSEAVDESEYRYFGPRPQTREAAIVMIADVVESTSKSSADHSEEAIRKILDESVLRMCREGQLDEAPITMKELATIKSYMLPILKGVHNQRIEYPPETPEEADES